MEKVQFSLPYKVRDKSERTRRQHLTRWLTSVASALFVSFALFTMGYLCVRDWWNIQGTYEGMNKIIYVLYRFLFWPGFPSQSATISV